MAADGFAEIQSQSEVAKLDREWELERETYLIVGAYGGRVVPDKLSHGLAGFGILVFGMAWTAIAASLTGVLGLSWLSILPFLGFVFMLWGLGLSVRAFLKAGQYQAGYERYQRRRNELLAKNPKA